MRCVSAFLAVALGAAWVLPPPTAAAPTDDDAAIRATLRVLVDRFNTRDAVSLGGEVDYEYIYLPPDFHAKDAFVVQRLAGREAKEAPKGPDLQGAAVSQLVGRNKGPHVASAAVLALRPPPPGAAYRQEITTAAQDYALAARRLLRWDLAYLFEVLPAEVMLQLKPLEIAVQEEAATVTVAYGFGLDVDTARGQAFTARTGTLTLSLRRLGAGWRLEDPQAFVARLRAVILE